MFCGVDEAGRGPVIGPLVVAGVCVDEAGLERLVELGVRDSKLLSRIQREEFYRAFKGFSVCRVVMVQAGELDRLMRRHSLNEIEARFFAEVIEALRPEVAFVDAADVRPMSFERMILNHVSIRPRLVVEHRADVRYPVVSAASIAAKVERDWAIEALHRVYGDFGSGYASDERTVAFIERCVRETGSFPDCVRRRWKTAVRASNQRLEEFF